MSLKWKVGILLLLLAMIIVTTPFFGRVETKQFSAYAACRKTAVTTKGYAVWEHKETIQKMFVSWVVFSDGFNDLSCQAIGMGPFWMVKISMHTLVGCAKSLDGEMCPEEYFGVNP